MKLCCDLPQVKFAMEHVNYMSVERPKDYQVSFSKGRRQHAFLYTAKGSLRYTLLDGLGETFVIDAGNLIFLPAGTKHISTYMEDDSMLLIVQFDLACGELPDYLHTPCRVLGDRIERLFLSICTDIACGQGDQSMYLLYRMYELFWQISQTKQEIPAKFRKLRLALEELRLYYDDNHKIVYYANLCGMSEAGFRRLFKEYTHLSPIAYRNQIRLQEAHKMLHNGERGVEEVAEQVGFSNFSFFCRTYKKQFGHSPGTDTNSQRKASSMG